jgi:ubiquinone/menaquinone biosynthesis C-methylase UbiE
MVEQQQRETGWQLHEHTAEAYERHLVQVFMAQGAQILVELAGVGEGDRVLDVATGTGIVARTALPRTGTDGKVAAVDLNEGMLAVARRLSEGLEPAIEWRLGDAQNLPYPDAIFDVAICQQGLQFLPDRAKALGEIHRVLVPGGRLVLSMMRPPAHNPAYPILADVVDGYLEAGAGEVLRSPFADISTAELRELLTATGFQDVSIIHGIAPVRYDSAEEFARLEISSSPIADAVDALPDHTREAMFRDARQALDDFVDDQGITFPAAVYVAVTHR